MHTKTINPDRSGIGNNALTIALIIKERGMFMTNVKNSSEIMTMTEDGNMFIALGSKTRHLLLLNIREERNNYD